MKDLEKDNYKRPYASIIVIEHQEIVCISNEPIAPGTGNDWE